MRQIHRKPRGKAIAKHSASPEKKQPAGLAFTLTKGILISLATSALLLTVGALILYFLPDPTALILPMGILLAAITAFAGGFVTCRIHGHAALICGLAHGTLLCALMLLCSLFYTNAPATVTTGHSGAVSALLHAGVILLSVAGAYLGGRAKQVRRRKH